MPKINSYENPISGVRPSETGVEATAAAARRSGQFFKETGQTAQRLAQETDRFGSEVAQVGEMEGRMYDQAFRNAGTAVKDAGDAAVDYMDHQQISHGAASYAGMLDGLTNQWNQTVKTADANDPTVAANFQKNVLEPQLEEFKNSFTTERSQQWAESHIDALRNHMFEKTTADMGTLAGIAVETNLKNTANTLANTAATDPTSVPHIMDTIDGIVQAQVATSPNLKGVAAAKATTEISEKIKEGVIKSAAFGDIQNSGDPEGSARKWIEQYPQYISGSEALQFARAARTQNRFNAAQDKAAAVAQKQADKVDYDQKVTSLISNQIRDDGTIAPATPEYFKTLKELAKMPGATREGVEAAFNWGQKETKIQTSNPDVLGGLQQKLVSGDTDGFTMDMVKAHIHGDLSDKDAAGLNSMYKLVTESPIKEKGVSIALEAAKAKMMVPTNYSDMVQDFLPAYLKAKSEGKDVTNALNFSDPNSMISRYIAVHEPSMSEKMQYQTLHNFGMSMTPNASLTAPAPSVPGSPHTPANLKQYIGQGLVQKGDQYRVNGRTYNKYGDEIK